MHHVAIMKKSWGLIPRILSGEKTIESRWYQTRRVPWGAIAPGDTIFFKNTGEPITTQATVAEVRQLEIREKKDVRKILREYNNTICIPLADVGRLQENPLPRYAILIFLINPRLTPTPFTIDKSGFGSAAAWLTLPDIRHIGLKTRAK